MVFYDKTMIHMMLIYLFDRSLFSTNCNKCNDRNHQDRRQRQKPTDRFCTRRIDVFNLVIHSHCQRSHIHHLKNHDNLINIRNYYTYFLSVYMSLDLFWRIIHNSKQSTDYLQRGMMGSQFSSKHANIYLEYVQASCWCRVWNPWDLNSLM